MYFSSYISSDIFSCKSHSFQREFSVLFIIYLVSISKYRFIQYTCIYTNYVHLYNIRLFLKSLLRLFNDTSFHVIFFVSLYTSLVWKLIALASPLFMSSMCRVASVLLYCVKLRPSSPGCDWVVFALSWVWAVVLLSVQAICCVHIGSLSTWPLFFTPILFICVITFEKQKPYCMFHLFS